MMSLQQSQVVVRFGCGINVLGIQKKNNPGRDSTDSQLTRAKAAVQSLHYISSYVFIPFPLSVSEKLTRQ